MNNQDTASKIIDRLLSRIATLTRENAILSVMVEEQNEELNGITSAFQMKITVIKQKRGF